MKLEREMMRGLGPTAVLQLLSAGEMYGYQIVEALAARSAGVFQMGQSTLYPMLYNLEAKGLLASTVKPGPHGKDRRYYRLTAAGKKRLVRDREQWSALVHGMGSLGLSSLRSLGCIPAWEGS
jgi:PadR family transcriptional regulator PadR